MQTGMISSTPTTAAPISSSATTTPSNALDANSFLQLLVTQLQRWTPIPWSSS